MSDELGVEAALREQGLVGPSFDNAAFVECNDQVGPRQWRADAR